MVPMLMGFQLPLVTQEITFGHLLQQEMDNVPVLASQVDMLHLLLSMETTFVKLEQEMMDSLLFLAIHYGMARAVLALIPAVNLITLYGSVSS